MSNLIIGTIQKHSTSHNKIFLSPELASHFSKGEKISISYGQESCQGSVIPISQKGRVALSTNLWNKLSLPFPQRIHLKIKQDGLAIGPLVGIYTSGMRPTHNQLGAQNTGLMRRYLTSQKKIPASYFLFGPQDIAYGERKIYGYFLKQDGSKGWQRAKVPLPNVIFNRIPNRTTENLAIVKKGKQFLTQQGCKLFNPDFFNKWTLHQSIHSNEQITSSIPETIFRPNQDQLKELLRKYKMIYLKPAGGSLGLGIIQLYQHPKQGVLARFRGNIGNQLKHFAGLEQAIRYFFSQRSLSRYIAQQGIQLIQLHNRPIDLRVHTNKDRYGKWQVTAIAAKVAGPGSVTTHMRTGGRVLAYKQLLEQTFPQTARQVIQDIERTALQLSQAIDAKIPGYIGELGFDIGVDQAGKPWMFEANAKPGRHVFVHSSLKEAEKRTRDMILDYSLYLSNFTDSFKNTVKEEGL